MNTMKSHSYGLLHKGINAHIASRLLKPAETAITTGVTLPKTGDKNEKLFRTLKRPSPALFHTDEKTGRMTQVVPLVSTE